MRVLLFFMVFLQGSFAAPEEAAAETRGATVAPTKAIWTSGPMNEVAIRNPSTRTGPGDRRTTFERRTTIFGGLERTPERGPGGRSRGTGRGRGRGRDSAVPGDERDGDSGGAEGGRSRRRGASRPARARFAWRSPAAAERSRAMTPRAKSPGTSSAGSVSAASAIARRSSSASPAGRAGGQVGLERPPVRGRTARRRGRRRSVRASRQLMPAPRAAFSAFPWPGRRGS